MKRLLGLLLAVMVMLFSTTAFAANYWTKTWAQGEYTITLTPEDEAVIADLRQKMDEGSVGTSLRTSIDNYPLSKAFEDFLLGGVIGCILPMMILAIIHGCLPCRMKPQFRRKRCSSWQ